jgi:hypothetical protein
MGLELWFDRPIRVVLKSKSVQSVPSTYAASATVRFDVHRRAALRRRENGRRAFAAAAVVVMINL